MTNRERDERLTALALGEADVTEELRSALSRDASLRAELEAIERTAAWLDLELNGPVGLALRVEQRAEIERAIAQRSPERAVHRGARRAEPRSASRWLAPAAALAVLVLAVGPGIIHWIRYGRPSRISEEGISLGGGYIVLADEPMRSVAGVSASSPGDEAELDPTAMGDDYDFVADNRFVQVDSAPRSTFSIDVDTAAYAQVRRFIAQDQSLPPRGAVRIEELINYFSYEYPAPAGEHPFTLIADVAEAPWKPEHRLVRIALQAPAVERALRPASNLVLLIDVSGSMASSDKLELLQRGLRLLVEELDARDRVSIVVYAGASGLVLAPTRGDRKAEILDALDRLEAGGATNGGEGIQLAYDLAVQGFEPGGVNRVLLATDGDFNVGITDQHELVELIQEQATSGVFLSVLGFGREGYRDDALEKLADTGNGNYAYIDTLREAHKVLVEQVGGTLITVAKDVKLQVEFNPREVSAYRLIGYENRVLADEDFADDTQDAGELGAGQGVTAFYEVVPASLARPIAADRELKYQAPRALRPDAARGELLTVSARYKRPDEESSAGLELAAYDAGSDARFSEAPPDFRFAAAVAAFGMLLRGSPHRGAASYELVLAWATGALGSGRDRASREELITLVTRARALHEGRNEEP